MKLVTIERSVNKHLIIELKSKESLLEELPIALMYEKSYMHLDRICSTHVTENTNYIITTSIDGSIKFWKKMPKGIEIVKQFKSNMKGITGTACSPDGSKFCSVSNDQTLKIFDVLSHDLVNIIPLKFMPGTCCWSCYQDFYYVAVSDNKSPLIYIFDSDGKGEEIRTINYHENPVILMAFNSKQKCIVSVDEMGVIE